MVHPRGTGNLGDILAPRFGAAPTPLYPIYGPYTRHCLSNKTVCHIPRLFTGDVFEWWSGVWLRLYFTNRRRCMFYSIKSYIAELIPCVFLPLASSRRAFRVSSTHFPNKFDNFQRVNSSLQSTDLVGCSSRRMGWIFTSCGRRRTICWHSAQFQPCSF